MDFFLDFLEILLQLRQSWDKFNAQFHLKYLLYSYFPSNWLLFFLQVCFVHTVVSQLIFFVVHLFLMKDIIHM